MRTKEEILNDIYSTKYKLEELTKELAIQDLEYNTYYTVSYDYNDESYKLEEEELALVPGTIETWCNLTNRHGVEYSTNNYFLTKTEALAKTKADRLISLDIAIDELNRFNELEAKVARE
jgi:hypothetical protein